MPVEHLKKGHFMLFWSFLAFFWQNKPFSKDSTDITAQYFLLIFDMLIQVNQKHLLAPFPACTKFSPHELKMAIRTKTSSRPQLSLKLVHTKGSVTQLHNIKEYTTTINSWKSRRKLCMVHSFCTPLYCVSEGGCT